MDIHRSFSQVTTRGDPQRIVRRNRHEHRDRRVLPRALGEEFRQKLGGFIALIAD